MAEVSVSQFAEVLKVPVDRLLVQLDQAGIKVSGPDARISDDAKLELLTHLRRSHGSDADSDGAPRKITLRRKTQSELKLASAQGRARTVNVEVRRKRTYIKRDVLEEQARVQQDELDHRRQQAEAAARAENERAEAERRERERLEAETRRRVEEEDARRRAQEDARRVAEQRSRDDEARRTREREEHERHAGERERPQALTPPPAAPRERPATAAPAAPVADDKQHTRYGRQELHVTGDVSSRYKKKRRTKARPVPASAEGRHGFEMPTAPVVHEVGIGETVTVAELAQKMAVKANEVIKALMNMGVMDTINQPTDQEPVVLVVTADGGVMPQTIEAIQHARAASVPIVVAVNKIDKSDADPDRVRTELSKHEVISEAWGGQNMFVPVSARTGQGIDQLLDAILLQAEVLELGAPRTGLASGVVIESSVEKGRGAVATVLVKKGTLRLGDPIIAGSEYGRVRAMFDENGKAVTEAPPSMPVVVLGLSSAPNAGDDLLVVESERKAREVALYRQGKFRDVKLARQAPRGEDAFSQIGEDKAGLVSVLIKADVQGSAEALSEALTKLSTEEVQVKIVSIGRGGITESDVQRA